MEVFPIPVSCQIRQATCLLILHHIVVVRVSVFHVMLEAGVQFHESAKSEGNLLRLEASRALSLLLYTRINPVTTLSFDYFFALVTLT